MEPYKLHVKVGPHEFNGEGAEESVRRDFEKWQALIGKAPTVAPMKGVAMPRATESDGLVVNTDDIDPVSFSKVFVSDSKNNYVSLRIRPQTDEKEGDAIVLILLGHWYLRQQSEVAVIQLKAAMIQSGFRVARVDRMAVRPMRQGFVHKGGAGKGGRYSLTNTGIEKAKRLLATLTTG